MGAMGFGLALGGLSALGSFASAQKQANAQKQQAAQMESQASALRANAALEYQRGEKDAEAIDRQKIQLRRQFNETQGRNRSLLAAGNVDMSSGSAADVAEGSINLFADDMGENAYSRAMRLHEASEQAKTLNFQADATNAQASYLKRTAGNLGTSLLTAALSGAGGFASGYSMAGGKLSSLFSTQSTSGQGISAISGGKLSLNNGPRMQNLVSGILASKI